MQVVGFGSAQHKFLATRRPAARRHRNRNLPGKITPRQRVRIRLDLGKYALGKELAAKFAGARS